MAIIITNDIPITNDGTYQGYQEFLKILEMHLVSLGISQAKQVLLIADGAEWIWKHIPPLLSRLGCPKETYQLLDFYHVTEHLQTFADAAFSEESERKAEIAVNLFSPEGFTATLPDGAYTPVPLLKL